MPSNRAQSRRYDLRPKRSLGQHFLKDTSYLEYMLRAAAISEGDRVLEIGPGTGVLTAALADRGAQVVAVELDERMAEYLTVEFADRPHVTILQGDILEIQPAEIMSAEAAADSMACDYLDYKVAANLPYYITSAILRRLLEAERPPTVAAVMVQKEVAERICSEPNDMSLLAVSVQYYASPKLIEVVPASAFYPAPKVDSAILRLDVYQQPAVPDIRTDRYFSVVRAGFSQRRKQIANSLSAGLGISKNEVRESLSASGIDPRRRAETMTLQEWRTICLALGRA